MLFLQFFKVGGLGKVKKIHLFSIFFMVKWWVEGGEGIFLMGG